MNELQALRQQRAELDAKIAEQEQAAKAATLTQVKELLDNAGLSAEEALHQLQQKPRAVVPPKYRNMDTGETWSGRGRKPKWFEQLGIRVETL